MPPRRSNRVNRGAPAQRGGRTGGRGGRGSGRGTGNNNNNNENPDFETIIARKLQGLLPTIVTQVGDHISNQGNNVSGNDHGDNNGGNDHANNGNHTNGNKGCTYREFSACKPVDFDGNGGAIAYTRWVEKMESVIDISECADHQKIKYAACSLTGKALTRWNTQIQARGREAAVGMSWDDFKALLMEEYCPDNEMQKLEYEFYHHAMVGAGHTAYTDRFHELARLVPHMVTPESKRIKRYIYGLVPEIHGMWIFFVFKFLSILVEGGFTTEGGGIDELGLGGFGSGSDMINRMIQTLIIVRN
ncbi:reverse transcriptase domain-containing protein [Artemisia annua]|uniref:Reverse transcriptase domain-containing protein n=1 Tax=Artemisia annua TaxID=35608 RepID=A0A2U1NRV6_ARTAN|nr:reverse transcriptase domain-containing protein [Artemisia annua]